MCLRFQLRYVPFYSFVHLETVSNLLAHITAVRQGLCILDAWFGMSKWLNGPEKKENIHTFNIGNEWEVNFI